MKKFQVVVAKSYIVIIKSRNKHIAKNLAEFYTSDISDISKEEDRKRFHFMIAKIECGMNESIDIKEI